MSQCVMVVEDDKNINEVVTEYLKDAGFAVLSFARGDDAFTAIQGCEAAEAGEAGSKVGAGGEPLGAGGAGAAVGLFVLDIMLPGVSGVELLRAIRKSPSHCHKPVIVLTALCDEAMQLECFDELADDFVTKPFLPRILVKRVCALMRRGGGNGGGYGDYRLGNGGGNGGYGANDNGNANANAYGVAGTYGNANANAYGVASAHGNDNAYGVASAHGNDNANAIASADDRAGAGRSGSGSGAVARGSGICVDYERFEARDGGDLLELTRREFELLGALCANAGKALSRQQLLNLAWGYDYFGEERIVDAHIKNLRKKLKGNPILTIKGIGYKLGTGERDI